MLQALLRVGQAQKAGLAAQAHLEQHADSTEALMLRAEYAR